MTTTTRGTPITSKYRGHSITVQWDLDWHLTVDDKSTGRMFLTLEAAEKAGKEMIDGIEKVKDEGKEEQAGQST